MEEESKFVKLLGNSPMIKVLDFLLVDREFDYSKKELSENSGISYNTLKSILPYLVSNEIIIKTRRIGKQDMFKLNTRNKYVKDMVLLFDSLIRHSAEDAKERAKAVQMAE
jgi:transcription initiation factor IIE alpha subunit